MKDRRDFLKTVAGATAGMMLTGGRLLNAAAPAQDAATKRRIVTVGGQHAKVVDIHSHCMFPEIADIVKGTKFESHGRAGRGQVLGPDRLDALDKRGIDVQVLDVNQFWWYAADRDLADKIVKFQNEKLAAWCETHPDRFVALTSVALQFPDLAAQQLEQAMKELKIRGAAIGGHVEGEPLSSPRFDPFWAKAEELNALIFMHPGGADNVVREDALRGKGDLGNVIGDPLETTVFLSHMIFDGTLDRFPGLRICAAHAGGYLPSYIGRTEVACDVRPAANCANKKRPSEYFKDQLLIDSMIFTEEGLRHLVATVGSGQILYGTDIPFNWPDSVDEILSATYLNDSQKEAMLGGTAAKLLRI